MEIVDSQNYWCIESKDSPYWVYVIKATVAIVIITENGVVMTALVQNWRSITRQHNLYRYLMSLVSADLMYGTILLLHAILWLVNATVQGGLNFSGENFQEVTRNLITGVLHGSIFVSIASATLLNLVLRITSTQALARAAAIPTKSQICLGKTSALRSPGVTCMLIGTIWVFTMAFIFAPIKHHCHTDLTQCVSRNPDANLTRFLVVENDEVLDQTEDPAAYDCSVLKAPTRRVYLIMLSACNTMLCGLMLLCNIITTCTKTSVQRIDLGPGRQAELRLRHAFGITRDTSSFFACIITLSMTMSTVPYIVFTFITETGSHYTRIHYGETLSGFAVEGIEMTTYLSSVVNPIVYTFMLSRLRSDVSRILVRGAARRRNAIRKPLGIRALTRASLAVYEERNSDASNENKWKLVKSRGSKVVDKSKQGNGSALINS